MISVFLINCIILTIAVLIHAEMLYRLSIIVPTLRIAAHLNVVLSVFGVLIAHIIEVWLFTFAYFLLMTLDDYGTLIGSFNGSLMDLSYFSFTTYTSLGIGDIEPIGHIRFLVGLEALTGLVLITWSASFLYLKMQASWKDINN